MTRIFSKIFGFVDKTKVSATTLNKSFLKFFLFASVLYHFQAYANSQTKPTTLEQFFPFILIGLFFYFLLIKPQQKKQKKHQDFVSKLKRGDEVLTNSGIYGRIDGLTEEFVILEVAENVCVRVARAYVSNYKSETQTSKSQYKTGNKITDKKNKRINP